MTFVESEIVELKQCYVDDIRKEVIAFANTLGGTIYVGVEDDGSICGIDDSNFLIQRIANNLRDNIRPDVTMFVSYEVLREDDKTILAVKVQSGTNKPYYLDSKGMRPSGVYVRQGTCSAPASSEAIRTMIKATDGDSYEEKRSLEQALTFNSANQIFANKGLEFGRQQMQSLGIIDSNGLYTNLGLLLSDQCPHIIKAAIFRDKTQNQFQSRKEFGGSLFKQLEDAYAYIDMANNLRSTIDGLYRKDKQDYPKAAVREALLNSIVHRDYGIGASTLISIYLNRMEFVSIGGLVNGVSLEDVLIGVSACRNPKLANIFYRLDLIEAYGTGLQKINSSYADYAFNPEFIATQGAFKVVLPNTNEQELNEENTNGSNKQVVREKQAPYGYIDYTAKVLHLIEATPGISRNEIALDLNLSASKAVRILKGLREEGLVYVMGNSRNIRYFRTSKKQ